MSSGDLLADRRFEYGRMLAADGDHAAAADLFAQALELAPGYLPGWVALGSARCEAGDLAGAADAFRIAADLDPDDVFGVALRLAAIGVAPVPAAPPPAYVRGLFDGYADRFDKALVEDLGYRTPWRIGDLLAEIRPAVGEGPTFARVLDLGCGTGLMAEVLRGRSGHIEGIDLSSEMVERARAKSVYDTLAVGDVLDGLGAGAPCDLITAGDVFVYVGLLDAVFAAVAARLAPGGLFAFSVEAAEIGDVILRDSLRYAHGEDYLRRLAAETGFTVLRFENETLRMDRGEPIAGWLVVLERMALCGMEPITEVAGEELPAAPPLVN